MRRVVPIMLASSLIAIAPSVGVEAARPQPTTETATAPFAASITSIRPFNSCRSPDVCRREASPTTGEATATALYVSNDGSSKQSTLSEAIQDFLPATKAKTITVEATFDLERADTATSVLGGGVAESRISTYVTMWSPQQWTFVSPATVLASSSNGTSDGAAAGSVTLSFEFRPLEKTTGTIGVQITFEQHVLADSSAGGSASASSSFAATVRSFSITY